MRKDFFVLQMWPFLQASRKETMSGVATANPLWEMQSTQSLSVPGGARKGRLLVGQWAHNSLLTRWSPSCSILNRYGCLSSHSHRGLRPRSCVLDGLGCPRRSGEESFYSSPGWRGYSACLTGVCPRMGVPGARMTGESHATLSWNQLPAKFEAESWFHGRCIGLREGVFGFNRYG